MSIKKYLCGNNKILNPDDFKKVGFLFTDHWKEDLYRVDRINDDGSLVVSILKGNAWEICNKGWQPAPLSFYPCYEKGDMNPIYTKIKYLKDKYDNRRFA